MIQEYENRLLPPVRVRVHVLVRKYFRTFLSRSSSSTTSYTMNCTGERAGDRTEEYDVSDELSALLGAFSSYHRVYSNVDASVLEGVTASFAVAVGGAEELPQRPLDARTFRRQTTLRVNLSRWDADELGRDVVIRTWDLTDAAAAKLNHPLAAAAVAEEFSGRRSVVVSNRGGYHSNPDALERLGQDGCESAGHLLELVKGVLRENFCGANDWLVSSGPFNTQRTKVTSSWFNVARAGHSHGLHNHAGAVWSGVYYASVPDCDGSATHEGTLAGHLIVRLCSGGLDITAPEDSRSGWCVWHAIVPKEGRLVMFPGWMLHGVLAVAGEVDKKPRVSYAFNAGELLKSKADKIGSVDSDQSVAVECGPVTDGDFKIFSDAMRRRITRVSGRASAEEQSLSSVDDDDDDEREANTLWDMAVDMAVDASLIHSQAPMLQDEFKRCEREKRYCEGEKRREQGVKHKSVQQKNVEAATGALLPKKKQKMGKKERQKQKQQKLINKWKQTSVDPVKVGK